MLYIKVTVLRLEPYTRKLLSDAHIKTLGDLMARSFDDLLRIRHLSHRRAIEIREALYTFLLEYTLGFYP